MLAAAIRIRLFSGWLFACCVLGGGGVINAASLLELGGASLPPQVITALEITERQALPLWPDASVSIKAAKLSGDDYIYLPLAGFLEGQQFGWLPPQGTWAAVELRQLRWFWRGGAQPETMAELFAALDRAGWGSIEMYVPQSLCGLAHKVLLNDFAPEPAISRQLAQQFAWSGLLGWPGCSGGVPVGSNAKLILGERGKAPAGARLFDLLADRPATVQGTVLLSPAGQQLEIKSAVNPEEIDWQSVRTLGFDEGEADLMRQVWAKVWGEEASDASGQ